ncbi:hypothetical protein VTJ04DRAFT_5971 [Mycothermus thermophilus]
MTLARTAFNCSAADPPPQRVNIQYHGLKNSPYLSLSYSP